MNAERLLAHYERVADAPDAIARLRRFILDLAVRGKLVPQVTNEEPASELLKRIVKAARQELKQEVMQLRPDEVPFDLPSGWAWSRIGEVCSKTGSGSTPRGGQAAYKDVGIPFLRSQNIYDDGLRLDDVAYIDAQTHARMAGTAVRPKDLLLNITGGSMGRCCLVPERFGNANVSQHVAILRAALPESADFLHRLVLSPYFQAFIFDEQTGAGRGGLPKNRMDRIAVALPPLPEQHRIVTKVDELMSLCDRLEAARAEREATRDRLTAASLVRLNAPDLDPATFVDHARFALHALPVLTTRPDQIKQLRQTIHRLAFQGLLTRRRDEDGSGLKLLDEICGQLREKKQKKSLLSKAESQANFYCEPAFEAPQSWGWIQLQFLCEQIGDIDHKMPPAVSVGVPFLSAKDLKDSGELDFSNPKYISEKDFIRLSRKILPRRGDIVYSRIGARLGKARLVEVDTKFLISYSCCLIRPKHQFVEKRFLQQFLDCDLALRQAHSGVQSIGVPDLGLGEIKAYRIPVPPLAEQNRIVAKLDELMALCDRLEASLAIGDDTRGRLLDALLHEALTPGEGLVPVQPETVAAHS